MSIAITEDHRAHKRNQIAERMLGLPRDPLIR